MSLLKIRNIETYYGPVMAIKGISLDVREQDFATILGANGAGKTTVLRTISGVLAPEKGSIEFQGRRIDGLDPDEIVKMGLYHVPEGREIFYRLTVRENLMMGYFLRRDKNGIKRDLEMVYEYFPILKSRSEQFAGLMSGGEQQMLAIGRALMGRPKLLLLDEPSLGLSPKLTVEIFNIIKKINAEQKTTILVVEQNANLALQYARHGYILELGRFVMDASCEKLRQNDDVKEFYLGLKNQGIRGERRWKRTKKWR
jgi:branched-chain amino acid transport system ATP-binding protein